MYKVFAERKVGISAFKGTLKFEAGGGFSNHRLELFCVEQLLSIQLAASKQTRMGGYATMRYNGQERRNQPDWSKMLYHVTLPRERLDAGSMANFLLHDKTRAT